MRLSPSIRALLALLAVAAVTVVVVRVSLRPGDGTAAPAPADSHAPADPHPAPQARTSALPPAAPTPDDGRAGPRGLDALVARSVELAARTVEPDGAGRPGRLRLVHVSGFKYARLVVEERFERAPDGTLDPVPVRRGWVADQALVRFADAATEADMARAVETAGGVFLRRLGSPGWAVVQVPDAGLETTGAALRSLVAAGGVLRAEPDAIVSVLATTPDDPEWPQLYGMRRIQAPEAWDITTGDAAIRVGVIDTGVDHDHPDLAANIHRNAAETLDGLDNDGNGFIDDVRGWDFYAFDNDPGDENGHGTHCAGTIGAIGDNALGVAGVAWRVSIVPLRFLGPDGAGSVSDSVDAVAYGARAGCRVLSNSWGGGSFSSALYDAIQLAGQGGVVFAAAAGNSAEAEPVYPARLGHAGLPGGVPELGNVVSVGATDSADNLAAFSNLGAMVAAPGVGILSTTLGRGYTYLDGTSMATPHVAGAAALVLTVRPDATPAQVRTWILASGDAVPALASVTTTGRRLNVRRALVENSTEPLLIHTDVVHVDSGGAHGGNGILNPGESVATQVAVAAVGPQPASGVTGTLSTTSPHVTLTRATVAYGDFAPLQVKAPAEPFLMDIAAGAGTPHTAAFTLTLRDGAGRTWTRAFAATFYTSATVTGTVRTRAAQPLAGAEVVYTGPFPGRVLTAADGTYAIPVVDGSLEVHAERAGFSPSGRRTLQVPPGRAGVDFTLGTVVLQPGAEALHATVRPGETRTLALTVQNAGDLALQWRLRPLTYSYEYVPGGLTDPARPELQWRDIAATGRAILWEELFKPVRIVVGTPSGTVDTGGVSGIEAWNAGPFSLGIRFPFFDETFTTVRIANTGWMSFTGVNRSVNHQPAVLPHAQRTENLLAFAWSQVAPGSRDAGGQRYRTSTPDPARPIWQPDVNTAHAQAVDAHHWVYSYHRMAAPFPRHENEYLTGQVELRSDGTIFLRYRSYEYPHPRYRLDVNEPPALGGPTFYVAGIQDATGTRGLTPIRKGLAHLPLPGSVLVIRPGIGAAWLRAGTRAGAIPAGAPAAALPLTFDATNLPEGTFTTSLVIDSNDSTGRAELAIPVTLTVSASAPPGDVPPPPPSGPGLAIDLEARDSGPEPTVVADTTAFVRRRDVAPVVFSPGSFSTWGSGAPADSGTVAVAAGGTEFRLGRQSVKRHPFAYTITPATVLEFDYFCHQALGPVTSHLHGVALTDSASVQPSRVFQVFGARTNWGALAGFNTYPFRPYGPGVDARWQRFRIPVGQHYTGAATHLAFVAFNDDPNYSGDIDVAFRNVRVYEAPGAGAPILQWTSDQPARSATGPRLVRTITTPGARTVAVEATDGVYSAAASRTVQVAGTERFHVRINFQPGNLPGAIGYLTDTGAVFGDRGNDLRYGWSTDRTAAVRHEGLLIFSGDYQADTTVPVPDGTAWDIEVPNGTYIVTLRAGSSLAATQNLVRAEGATVMDINLARYSYMRSSARAVVTDGRLTLVSHRNTSVWNSVEIVRESEQQPPPVAAFTVSGNAGALPAALVFDAGSSFSPAGTIAGYAWDFGDGATGSGVVAAHTFTTAGFRTVTLTVTDDAGRETTTSAVFPIGGAIPPVVTLHPSGGTFAAGTGVTLQVDAQGLPDPVFQWRRNGRDLPGRTGRALQIPGAVEADSGAYDVVVSNSAGRVRTRQAVVAVVPPSAAGTLVAWNFHAQGELGGGAVSVAPGSVLAGVGAGSLTRGPAFPAGALGAYADRGAFNGQPASAAASLAAARAAGEYIHWVVEPAAGSLLSVGAVRVVAYHQAGSPVTFTLEASRDGFATPGVLLGAVQSGTNWNGVEGVVSTASVAALQGADGPVAFRAYMHGASPWNDRGLGGVPGSNIDLAVEGAVGAPQPTDPASLWRLARFGSAQAVGDAAEDADPDEDGVPNLLERAYGTNPTDDTSGFRPVPSIVRVGGGDYPALTFRRVADPVAERLAYEVEEVGVLPDGAWPVPAGSFVEHAAVVTSDGVVLVTLRSTTSTLVSPQRFLRLRVRIVPVAGSP